MQSAAPSVRPSSRPAPRPARPAPRSTPRARALPPSPFSEPPFEALSSDDADVRTAALRTLIALRDPSLFVVLCVSEAIDEVLRERALLPRAPLTWRGWRGLVLGPVLSMSPGDRMVWALEFAEKLVGPQRYPRVLVSHFDQLFEDEPVADDDVVDVRVEIATDDTDMSEDADDDFLL